MNAGGKVAAGEVCVDALLGLALAHTLAAPSAAAVIGIPVANSACARYPSLR